MAHYLIKHILYGALCAGAAFSLTSCTDDSYDLDKVDLTMGIGSEGLSATLGTTEKIHLADILEEDKSVKTDAKSLYYMVKSESVNYDFNIKKVTTSINSPELTSRVLNYNAVLAALKAQGGNYTSGQVLPIPANFSATAKADATKASDFQVNFTTDDVISIKNAAIQPTSISLVLKQSTSTKISIKELNNIVIELPKYMHVAALTSGWTLSSDNKLTCSKLQSSQIGKEICKLTLSSIDINKEVVSKKINVSDNVRMTANVVFTNNSGSAIQWKTTDYADIILNVNVGTGNKNKAYALTVNEVTGKFNPTIDPTIKTIDIEDELPDFLTGDDVALNVANPTVRLEGDLTNIPVGVNVGCTLTPFKNKKEETSNKVVVNKSGVTMEAKQENTVYFYKGKSPYDPEGLAEKYVSKVVDDLNNLVKDVPDYIVCNMQNGQVTVQDKEYTVALGNNYKGQIDYKIFVPFEFNNGLQIAYKDSTNSLNSDLKDYAAKGIRVTTDVENQIPLDLKVSIEAFDVNGKKISTITFKDASGNDYAIIPASKDGSTITKTNVELNADLAVPQDLSKVDRFKFKVNTSNTDASKSHQLYSTQYLQFKDIKLRLKGGVTIDFN